MTAPIEPVTEIRRTVRYTGGNGPAVAAIFNRPADSDDGQTLTFRVRADDGGWRTITVLVGSRVVWTGNARANPPRIDGVFSQADHDERYEPRAAEATREAR